MRKPDWLPADGESSTARFPSGNLWDFALSAVPLRWAHLQLTTPISHEPRRTFIAMNIFDAPTAGAADHRQLTRCGAFLSYSFSLFSITA